MKPVVKETPAVMTGLREAGSTEGEWSQYSLQDVLCSPWASLELRGPMTGLGGQVESDSACQFWFGQTKQVKAPSLLNQMRKPKRTGWVWRER